MHPNDLQADGASSAKQDDETKTGGNLVIIPRPTKPKNASTRRKLTIKKVSRSGGGGSNSYSRLDGDFCESKVFEIEENFEPPRFPLLVGHYTGEDAFGCDILSFATYEAREEFRLNKNRDLNLVERFIEVKGRKDNQAEIELRGNEKKAALKYGDKYYLYRISKISKDNFNLTILSNPLIDPKVVEHSVYIDLDRSTNSEVYEIATVSVSHNRRILAEDEFG